MKITDAQRDAVKWLAEHGGDGGFLKSGVLLAAGEVAPVMRRTWNTLEELGKVEFYSNRKRLRLTT